MENLQVRLLAFQLMPDHVHGILFVQETMEEHLGQVISGFKAGCNKAFRRLVGGEAGAGVVSPAISTGERVVKRTLMDGYCCWLPGLTRMSVFR